MKYNEYIMKDVREYLGLEPNDVSQDKYINNMTSDEILEAVLEWNGIIGYTNKIKDLIQDIYKVKLEDK